MRIQLLIGSLLLSMGASAVPILQIEGGQLIGANGVDVDNMSYNVRFKEGTCTEVFGVCDGNFATEAMAQSASQALLNQVFTDMGAGAEYDSNPALTFGCSEGDYCDVFTTYVNPQGAANSPLMSLASNNAFSFGDQFDAGFPVVNFSTSTDPFSVWAVWEKSATVSVSGTLTLLSLGMLGLFAQRRRSA